MLLLGVLLSTSSRFRLIAKDLAGHMELVQEPLPLSSGMRGQPVHCINPATGTDNSVKHVKQVIREEKARRERRARGEPETPTVTEEEEQEEAEDPEASAAPEDDLPEAQRDAPEAQAPARKQSLLEQLLQQQVLNESSLRRFLPQQTLCPTTALRDLNSRPPAAERPASAGGHCAGCGGLHVVREEFPENFPRTACTSARSRRKSEPVPKVANVGVKVKLDRLVANRAATRATGAATSQSCLRAACRASAKSGRYLPHKIPVKFYTLVLNLKLRPC
ncbi:HERC1 [Symbiodinium sp. CCMP2456]|nr:HERC1 [Symbiodinium sp. CCMP2456]